MSRLRAIKDRARRGVHREMCVPAIYLPTGAVDDPTPVTVNVRLHLRTSNLSADMEGAVRRDTSPRIVFDRSEISMPAKGAVVSVAEGEAYKLGAADVPDGGYIAVGCAPVPLAQTDGFPIPTVPE